MTMRLKKVQLGWVENDKARAICLRRRRDGLVKKVKELTILCDIMACLIIFSPNEAEPVVWPSLEMGRGLLDDFFALPKSEQKKKEMGIESFLKEKTNKIHEQMMKSRKKSKEYATNELMMQLHHERGINDLNLSEIYGLLSFLKDQIILWRKKLDFMQFSPLRDPPVLPFELQVEQLMIPANDAFVGDSQDKDETTRIIRIDTLRANKSHYLTDIWFSNPNSFRPYQGSSSHGNPNLEMQPAYPQVMALHGVIESASQPLQHNNMNNNPTTATNDPNQNPFDFMSRELEIQEGGNETNAREDNDNVTSFDSNRFWLDFCNRRF